MSYEPKNAGMTTPNSEFLTERIKDIRREITAVAAMKQANRKLCSGYCLHPGGILNAYAEGDLSFDEAVKELEHIAKSKRDEVNYAMKRILEACIESGFVIDHCLIAGSVGEQIATFIKGLLAKMEQA